MKVPRVDEDEDDCPRDGGCWRHPESAGNNINFGICLPRRSVPTMVAGSH